MVFNEITKKAITEAFKQPSQLDQNRVNAQQARRFPGSGGGLHGITPAGAKVARGTVCRPGTVVAVRLVVERERKYTPLCPRSTGRCTPTCSASRGDQVRFQGAQARRRDVQPDQRTATMAAVAELESCPTRCAQREDKPTRSKPSAPFITLHPATGCQYPAGLWRRKTMMMAQRLYEAGYITYMRTDSTNLSTEAVAACREYIGVSTFPGLPAGAAAPVPLQRTARRKPTRPFGHRRQCDKNALKDMERDAERLYKLIWRQFVACQMPDAEHISTVVTVAAGEYQLNAKGRLSNSTVTPGSRSPPVAG